MHIDKHDIAIAYTNVWHNQLQPSPPIMYIEMTVYISQRSSSYVFCSIQPYGTTSKKHLHQRLIYTNCSGNMLQMSLPV
jgi:hypothetical protein